MKTIEQVLPTPAMRRDMDFAANRLPSSDVLDGTPLDLVLDDGTELKMELDDGHVRWSLSAPDGGWATGDGPYDAVELRTGVVFLDLSSDRQAISVVLDRGRDLRALVCVGELVERDGRMRLTTRASPARARGAEAYEPIASTDELIGQRLSCEYSDRVVIEHTYLNSGTVGWQWLRTPIADLAFEVGTQPATYWRIAEDLYVMSSFGEGADMLVLALDLARWRSVGRMFGWGYGGRLDVRCGARLAALGAVEYAGDRRPA